jgi:hypothetical protein
MGPFDYIFAFVSEAAAQADPVVGAWWSAPSAQSSGGWVGNTIPGLSVTVNGSGGTIQVTDESGNVTTQPGPDKPLDSLWRIAIATRTRDPKLDASPALEVSSDRGLALSGAPLAAYVIFSAVPLENLSALTVSPKFAGSPYGYGTAYSDI